MSGESGGPGPRAAAATERVFAVTAALFRLGSLVLLGLALISASHDRWLYLVGAVAGAQGLAFGIGAARADRLRRLPVALDVAGVAVLLALTSGGLDTGRQSPLYNYASITLIAAGLVDWPLWTAWAVVLLPNLVVVGSAALPRHSTYPLWIAVPDAVVSVGVATVAWVIAGLQRRVARARDREAEVAVGRARDLAGERERRRQAEAVGPRLLSTLDELAGAGTMADPVLLDEVRREADWLRDLVARGLPEPPPSGLLRTLRELATAKLSGGLAVDLVLPPTEPVLSGAQSEALAGATREALTNVAKHAGTRLAQVTVTAGPDAVMVDVIDHGHGYDPAVVAAGHGQAGSIHGRMAAVGGTAQVHSAPGRGTRVTLRLPAPR